MQETFRLRKFNVDDLKSVTNINRVCLPENYSDYFFTDLHRRFPETFLIAEENGEVIGYIMCRIEMGFPGIGFHGLIKKGHIISVAVMPSYRRKGIGKALVSKAMENMRSYKARQCFLEVRVTNEAAINLYRELGFQAPKTIQNYYADSEDAYVMSINLSIK